MKQKYETLHKINSIKIIVLDSNPLIRELCLHVTVTVIWLKTKNKLVHVTAVRFLSKRYEKYLKHCNILLNCASNERLYAYRTRTETFHNSHGKPSEEKIPPPPHTHHFSSRFQEVYEPCILKASHLKCS